MDRLSKTSFAYSFSSSSISNSVRTNYRPASTLQSCSDMNGPLTSCARTICITGGRQIKTGNLKRQKLIIVAGEQRSANRTAWSSREETDACGDQSVALASPIPAIIEEDCRQEVSYPISRPLQASRNFFIPHENFGF